MLYMEAVQKARRSGLAPKMSESPVSSSAPSPPASEKGSENEEDEEAGDGGWVFKGETWEAGDAGGLKMS